MTEREAPDTVNEQTSPKSALPQASALIVAAGRSSRMGGVDKLFVDVAGQPLLARTLAAFEECPYINHVTVVLALDSAERALELLKKTGFRKIDATCVGGEHRQDSVRAGLRAMRACDWVVVHDGARPLVTPKLIEDGIAAALETGAASAGQPAAETLKQVASDGTVLWTIPRQPVWTVQTPQVFRYDILCDAHEQQDLQATDDAELIERAGGRVRLYQGSSWNLKVTTAEDVALIDAMFRLRSAGSEHWPPRRRSAAKAPKTQAASPRPESRTPRAPRHAG
jgi:2-C-methyl-D-erythritol 4-phosphate cytidylyltransferase